MWLRPLIQGWDQLCNGGDRRQPVLPTLYLPTKCRKYQQGSLVVRGAISKMCGAVKGTNQQREQLLFNVCGGVTP